MQFGSMQGIKTTNAIFIFRQFQENNLAKKKKSFHLAFVDSEKAFDRVPRNAVLWASKN